jgi:hypothetical protein
MRSADSCWRRERGLVRTWFEARGLQGLVLASDRLRVLAEDEVLTNVGLVSLDEYVWIRSTSSRHDVIDDRSEIPDLKHRHARSLRTAKFSRTGYSANQPEQAEFGAPPLVLT